MLAVAIMPGAFSATADESRMQDAAIHWTIRPSEPATATPPRSSRENPTIPTTVLAGCS